LDKSLRNDLFMPYEALTRQRLDRALRRLGELAEQNGLVLELSLYGGAVFTLVYGSRDSTKDVDGIILPSAPAKPLLAQIAREQDLPDDWLNSQVAQFLSPVGTRRAWTGHEFGSGLRISVPTAAYLLALKLRACRPPLPGFAGDEGDIQFLLARIRPRSLRQVAQSYEQYFPGDVLAGRALALVQQYLEGREQ